MKYFLFGDSIGFSVADYENGGWAERFRQLVNTQEKHTNFFNLSISGETSRGLLGRMRQEAAARIKNTPKVEVVFIISTGRNDSRTDFSDKNANVSEEDFNKSFLDIIKIAKELAGQIFVLGVTPVYEEKTFPFHSQIYYSNKRLETYNKLMQKHCEKEGIPFKDFFETWQKKNLKEIFEDGLHPNSEGHKILFDEIKEFIIKG